MPKEYQEQEDEFGEDHFDADSEEEMRMIVKDFLSRDNIEGNTDLNPRMIRGIFKLLVLDRHYPGMGIKEDLREFMVLRLSHDRGSRKEQVEILRDNEKLKGNDSEKNRVGF